MLRHLEELFYPVPTKIIYMYGVYQKEFDELPPDVELLEGFPDNLRWLPRVLFSYNRIYRDQTLFARITRGMFVASYNKIFHIQS